MLPGLLVAATVGGATLGRLGVDAVREGLAAVVLAAHGLRGAPGQVVPNPCGLLVAEAILAVTDVAVAQSLHEGPRLQQAGLGILKGPPAGPQVGDDLESAKQVPGALRQGPAVLGAHGAGPQEVEVPQSRFAQFHDVAADGGLGSRSTETTSQPLAAKALPIEPVPLKSSRSLGILFLRVACEPDKGDQSGDEAGHLQVADHAVSKRHRG